MTNNTPFVHEGEVYHQDGDGNETVYNGPWPVTVWLLSEDCGDGCGWNRSLLEKHGVVLEHHTHDHDTQAVKLAVKTRESFTLLFGFGNGCYGYQAEEEAPSRL